MHLGFDQAPVTEMRTVRFFAALPGVETAVFAAIFDPLRRGHRAGRPSSPGPGAHESVGSLPEPPAHLVPGAWPKEKLTIYLLTPIWVIIGVLIGASRPGRCCVPRRPSALPVWLRSGSAPSGTRRDRLVRSGTLSFSAMLPQTSSAAPSRPRCCSCSSPEVDSMESMITSLLVPSTSRMPRAALAIAA